MATLLQNYLCWSVNQLPSPGLLACFIHLSISLDRILVDWFWHSITPLFLQILFNEDATGRVYSIIGYARNIGRKCIKCSPANLHSDPGQLTQAKKYGPFSHSEGKPNPPHKPSCLWHRRKRSMIFFRSYLLSGSQGIKFHYLVVMRWLVLWRSWRTKTGR